MTQRARQWLAILLAVAVLAWLVPPFRIVPLDAPRSDAPAPALDPAAFAERFWADELMPAMDRAAEVCTVLDALTADRAAAEARFGHSVGVGGTFAILVQGRGRVVDAHGRGVALALRDGATDAEVLLLTGPIFGNTVRDATGRLDVSRFANSQEFNAIASELNRLVETRVANHLRERAKVGDEIQFVAAAEVSKDGALPKPLKLVPLRFAVVVPQAKP